MITRSGVVTIGGHSCASMKSPRMGAGFSWVDGLLVEDRSQTEKSSTDQNCQQSSKERVPWEGPAEEEGCAVEQKKHQSGNWKATPPDKIKSYSEKFGCLCEDFETHLHPWTHRRFLGTFFLRSPLPPLFEAAAYILWPGWQSEGNSLFSAFCTLRKTKEKLLSDHLGFRACSQWSASNENWFRRIGEFSKILSLLHPQT